MAVSIGCKSLPNGEDAAEGVSHKAKSSEGTGKKSNHSG